MRVAIIGAGPSGLVTLKYLITAQNFFPVDPIEVVVFEAEDAIGGTFTHRQYEDGEMVSSKYLTTFSDFRYIESDPKKDPDFMAIKDYVSYLERYCTTFNLWPHIRLNTRVKQIKRNSDGTHHVTFQAADADKEELSVFDAVAVCSGLHVTPDIPHVPGIEHVPKVLHSSEFKKREDFGRDTTVMVLGCGETGMDMGYLAVTSPTKSVFMCHRNGFLAAPKRVPRPVVFGLNPPSDKDELNEPVDCSGAALLDTMYVHRKLEESRWLWNYYDRFVRATLFLNFGTTSGAHQFVGRLDEERYHVSSVFFVKSSRAMPYIAAPWRPQTRLAKLKRKIINVPIPDTHDRYIDLAPWPQQINADGTVTFRDTGRPESEKMKTMKVKPDVVVFCTGYRQEYPFLDPSSNYPNPDTLDTRRIWHSSDPTTSFIGFVRPGFGAIPPLSELQAQLWILALLQHFDPHTIPPRFRINPEDLGKHPYYNLRIDNVPIGEGMGIMGRGLTYGVEHESYAYQLALDMHAAPSLFAILKRGPKMLLCWALAPNFNTKFRLEGPWAWRSGNGDGKEGKGDGADGVMLGELWESVARRGVFANVTLSGLPILFFGVVSFWLWVFWGIIGIFVSIGRGLKRAVVGEKQGKIRLEGGRRGYGAIAQDDHLDAEEVDGGVVRPKRPIAV